MGLKTPKRYYNCANICHRCAASLAGPKRYQTLADDAVCFKVLQATAAFIAEVGGELSKLPGFDVQDTVLSDWMHCGPLGIEGISNGATLLELVLEGKWGDVRGEWKIRCGIALKIAFADFKKFCSERHLVHSQQQFTCASLGVADGQEYQPVLKGKAHNETCVTRWLSELLRNDTATQHGRFVFKLLRNNTATGVFVIIKTTTYKAQPLARALGSGLSAQHVLEWPDVAFRR